MKVIPQKEPIHIGAMIRDRLSEIGMKKAEFARRICCTRQNVDRMLKQNSINSELLFQISMVLERDFFTEYVARLSERTSIHQENIQNLSDWPRLELQESDGARTNPPHNTIRYIFTVGNAISLESMWNVLKQHFPSLKTRRLG